jgi:hypothetical protein
VLKVFSFNKYDVVRAKTQYTVYTKGNPSTLSYRPRLSPKEKTAEILEVEKLLKSDLIETALSEFAAPMLLLTKIDGTIRVVIDYRGINKCIVFD